MRALLLLLVLSAPALAVEHDEDGRPQWTYCAPEELQSAGGFRRLLCLLPHLLGPMTGGVNGDGVALRSGRP